MTCEHRRWCFSWNYCDVFSKVLNFVELLTLVLLLSILVSFPPFKWIKVNESICSLNLLRVSTNRIADLFYSTLSLVYAFVWSSSDLYPRSFALAVNHIVWNFPSRYKMICAYLNRRSLLSDVCACLLFLYMLISSRFTISPFRYAHANSEW